MDKKEVIEEIKERFGCDEQTAKQILRFGVSKGHIKRFVKMDVLISYFILFAVFVSVIWALVRVL